jgi:hypothetical protein
VDYIVPKDIFYAFFVGPFDVKSTYSPDCRLRRSVLIPWMLKLLKI